MQPTALELFFETCATSFSCMANEMSPATLPVLSSSNGALWRAVPAPCRTGGWRCGRPARGCRATDVHLLGLGHIRWERLVPAGFERSRNCQGDKGSTAVVSPNHTTWKAHHVAHKEAEEARAPRCRHSFQKFVESGPASKVNAARRATCRDVEVVTGVGGKSVRVLFTCEPLRSVDGTGVPGRGEGILGLVVSREDEIAGRLLEVPKATLQSSKESPRGSELGPSELPLVP